MKKVLFTSAVVAALIFSGCSSKDAAIDVTDNAGANQEQNGGAGMSESLSGDDMTVSEDGSINVEDQAKTMSDLEAEMESIYFDFDKFNIKEDEAEKVDHNAKIAMGDASSYLVKVEGNCDEWGSDEYNYALGLKRANSVKDALVEKGIDASRISMVSYGESNPVCSDKTKECWAKNRRVDFKLLP